MASKTAIILGGTHGIGLVTAQLLQDKGFRVLVTGRRPEPVAESQKVLGTTNALVIQSDITDLGSCSNIIERAALFFQPPDPTSQFIDLVFVNVGLAVLGPFASVTPEVFDATYSTNVRGPFFTTQALLPHIKDKVGAIVFTTSVAALYGVPSMSAYSSSKAAIKSLTQTLAAELVSRGIRVNNVSPGYVRTPTLGVSGATPELVTQFAELGATQTPLQRIAEPEEIARTVYFVGVEATFMTGAEVAVDGGLGPLKVGGDH